MSVCVLPLSQRVLLEPGSIAACALYNELIRYSSCRPRLSLNAVEFTKHNPV
ncbi:MAG: hypothetical protein QOH22_1428, partial [Gemmatimonadaceae bacterium]|nr:hypothetical protein [Gemmatimonadaceae bacterium]